MIEKIRTWLIAKNILNISDEINIDFLNSEPTKFAIEQVKCNPIIERYTNGGSYRQFQFQLVSCNYYGADDIQNVSNSSFYENLVDKIDEYNLKGDFPEIGGIDGIECLDNGGIDGITDNNTARYGILMKITYER